MTTFQLVLVGFGVVLVLAVMLYNWLQERKFREALRRSLGETANDAMLEAAAPALEPPASGRIEPHIQLESVLPEAPDGTMSQAEPSGAAADEGRETGGVIEPPPQPFVPESPLDDATEYIARLRFAHPVSLSYSALLESLRPLGKPIRAMGKREDGTWEALAGPSHGRYSALELGLQLVDRSGAVTRGQLEAFRRTLYGFAAEHGGAVSCPDLDTALEQARALDLLCMEVDAMIGLNVVAPDWHPFALADVQRLAVGAGMSLAPDGTYVLLDAQGRALFTLSNQGDAIFQEGMEPGTTHGVTLLLEVPTVTEGLDAFDRMAALAQQMASALGGNLVDDNGRHVSRESLERIRQRLAEVYASMEARGIPAGGERARRLFV